MDRNSIINLHKKGLKNTEIAKALRINSLANIKALWREGRRNRQIKFQCVKFFFPLLTLKFPNNKQIYWNKLSALKMLLKKIKDFYAFYYSIVQT